MTVTLNPEARARLDQHLDAVEAALTAAGHSRNQRRAILDDLESQITDMLAARSQAPALADVEAVLAQLDPPAAYRQNPATQETPTESPPATTAPAPGPTPPIPPLSPLGVISLLIFSTAGLGSLAILVFALGGPIPDWTQSLGWLAFLLCFAGVTCGILGTLQKSTRRAPALAGLILNALVILATLAWLLCDIPPHSPSPPLSIDFPTTRLSPQPTDLYPTTRQK